MAVIMHVAIRSKLEIPRVGQRAKRAQLTEQRWPALGGRAAMGGIGRLP